MSAISVAILAIGCYLVGVIAGLAADDRVVHTRIQSIIGWSVWLSVVVLLVLIGAKLGGAA